MYEALRAVESAARQMFHDPQPWTLTNDEREHGCCCRWCGGRVRADRLTLEVLHDELTARECEGRRA